MTFHLTLETWKVTMILTQSQFAHMGLWQVYCGRSSGNPGTIALTLEGKCRRLLDVIANATVANDPDMPGMGYKCAGNLHSLDVNGHNTITYFWSLGKAHRINYV